MKPGRNTGLMSRTPPQSQPLLDAADTIKLMRSLPLAMMLLPFGPAAQSMFDGVNDSDCDGKADYAITRGLTRLYHQVISVRLVP